MSAERIIDCRGLRCPAPIIELARALKADGDDAVPIGSRLGVAATDVAARVDVPAFCRMRGQEYLGETAAEDGVAVYWLRRLT